MELLLTSFYAPFTAALAALAVVLLIELVAVLVVGVGPTTWLEATVDLEALPNSMAVDWLLLKELPLSVILMMACGTFGSLGFALQEVFKAVQGTPAPFYLAGPLALVATLIVNKHIGKLLAPLFRTHTTAVSEDMLLGRTGLLLSPRIAEGFAGEFKVYDQHGQAHYVMVEPEPGHEFKAGEELRLVGRRGSVFIAQPAVQRLN